MELSIEKIAEGLIHKYSPTSLKQYYHDMSYDANLHRRACIANALNQTGAIIADLKVVSNSIDYPHAVVIPMISQHIEVEKYLNAELIKTHQTYKEHGK